MRELRVEGPETNVTLTRIGLANEKSAKEHEGGWREILQWLEE